MHRLQNDYALIRNEIHSILQDESDSSQARQSDTLRTKSKLKNVLKSLVHISEQKDVLQAAEQKTIREMIQFHVDQIKTKNQVDYQGLRQCQIELKNILNRNREKGEPRLARLLPDIQNQTTTDVASSTSSSSSSMLQSAECSLNDISQAMANTRSFYNELDKLIKELKKCTNQRQRVKLLNTTSKAARSCLTSISAASFHATKLCDELNQTDTNKPCLPDESVRNLAKLLHDKTDHESPMYQQLQRLIEPKPSQVEVNQIYTSQAVDQPEQSLLHKVNSKLDILLAHNKLDGSQGVNMQSFASTDKRSTKRKLGGCSPLKSPPPVKKERRRLSTLKTKSSPVKKSNSAEKRNKRGVVILPALKSSKKI